MICNLGVVGSNPTRGSLKGLGEYQSGQMGQTVNLLSFDFGGSNPSSPTQTSFFDILKENISIRNDSVAQLVEQLTLNQWVEGSSPSGVTMRRDSSAG